MRNEPNPIDVEVGLRIKARRKVLKMSQTELSLAIGVSYQQVQKYEKGTNRVSASMLHAIARSLGVPVDALLSGVPGEKIPPLMTSSELLLIGRLQRCGNGQRSTLLSSFHRILDSVAGIHG